MEPLILEIARQLNCSLSSDVAVVASATQELDQLSRLPDFPLALIFIARGLILSVGKLFVNFILLPLYVAWFFSGIVLLKIFWRFRGGGDVQCRFYLVVLFAVLLIAIVALRRIVCGVVRYEL